MQVREGTKEYEIWLGVKLRTEARSGHEATALAIESLASVLRAQNPDGITAVSLPVDLVEPVVRVLQQMGEERRRSEEPAVAAVVGAHP